jgi:hypothetical protein
MLEVYKVAASNFGAQLLQFSGNVLAAASTSKYGIVRAVASNLTPKLLVVSMIGAAAFMCFNAAILARSSSCFKPMAPIYLVTGLTLAIAAVAAFVLLPTP